MQLRIIIISVIISARLCRCKWESLSLRFRFSGVWVYAGTVQPYSTGQLYSTGHPYM